MGEALSDSAAALAALERGELVVFPTETVYGVGCRLDRPRAIEALFALKGRPRDKACQVLLPSPDAIESVAIVETRTEVLSAAFMPGPLTLILPALPGLHALVAPRGAVGVRVPSHPAARAILAAAGPLVASSANRSGSPTPLDLTGLRAAFGDEVGAYLDAAPRPAGVASTVVDATGSKLVLLREGALGRGDLRRAAGHLAWDW